MRRMVKENLFKMDGTPSFPRTTRRDRSLQARVRKGSLYKAVTEYVREEFNQPKS